MQKLKALFERLPSPVREQAKKVGYHFVSSFTGTFLVFLPGVYAAPDFTAAKALAVSAVVASFTAAVRATVPVAKAAVKALADKYLA